MSTAQHTAFSTFTDNADDCATLLDHLGQVLVKCREAAKADPRDWGHAGSMGHVRDNLIQTLAFIGGLDEASIEETLAELREGR